MVVGLLTAGCSAVKPDATDFPKPTPPQLAEPLTQGAAYITVSGAASGTWFGTVGCDLQNHVARIESRSGRGDAASRAIVVTLVHGKSGLVTWSPGDTSAPAATYTGTTPKYDLPTNVDYHNPVGLALTDSTGQAVTVTGEYDCSSDGRGGYAGTTGTAGPYNIVVADVSRVGDTLQLDHFSAMLHMACATGINAEGSVIVEPDSLPVIFDGHHLTVITHWQTAQVVVQGVAGENGLSGTIRVDSGPCHTPAALNWTATIDPAVAVHPLG